MDLVVGVEGVQVLGLVKIPEHGGAVLATRGAEGTVGGDGDGVDVASVADVVGLQLAAGEFPDLLIERKKKKNAQKWLVCTSHNATEFLPRLRIPTWHSCRKVHQAKVISLSHGLKGSEVANT